MPKKAEPKGNETGLIVVKQLPVIEDQLLAVKSSIEERVKVACSLVCTEDTYKQIKQVRSDLNKEYQELEKRRKEVKASILAPYEQFEGVYKECAGDIYLNADRELKAKIDEVESGLKKQKADDLEKYFYEYLSSVGIDDSFVSIDDAKIKVGLSDSRASLRKQAAAFIDRIADDLKVIEAMPNRDELMVAYSLDYNLSKAMITVENRRKAIEAERQRREEMQIVKETENERQEAIKEAVQAMVVESVSAPNIVAAPVATPQEYSEPENPGETVYRATFTVSGTLEQLKELKQFLKEGGFVYESR